MITTYALKQTVHACVFGQVPIVSGLTDDLVLVDGQLETVAEGLARELRRAYDGLLVAEYDVLSGLRAADPTQAAELRRAYVDLVEAWPAETPGRPPELETGQQLAALAPAFAVRAIGALLRQSERPIGVIVDHADLLLNEPLRSDAGTLALGGLREAFVRRGVPRALGAPNPLALVARGDLPIGGALATHPLAQAVVVSPPVLDERAHIVDALGLDAEVAQRSSGLSRRRLHVLESIARTLPEAPPERLVRVATNGMPRRPWSRRDRDRIRDHVAPAVRAALPGQEAIADAVCLALAVAGTPRVRAKGPRDVFLLAGPPAVGKTELVRLIARELFGDENAIRRFDMTEYMESHSRAKLIGAPPGYVGFEGGGQLTDWVLSNPDSIVLLDELEKAHEHVLLLLLQILEDGRLTDGQGRTVDFSGVVLFMTTNLGSAKAIEEVTAGGNDPDRDQLAARMKELIRHALCTPRDPHGDGGGLGRPELWSRLQDSVHILDVIRRANVPRMVDRLVEDFDVACADAGTHVRFNREAIVKRLAAHPDLHGLEGTWDARTVLKLVREDVERPVRRALAWANDDVEWEASVGATGITVHRQEATGS